LNLPYEDDVGRRTKVTLYDLGGGRRVRSLWKNYLHDVHGIIWVARNKPIYSNQEDEGDDNEVEEDEEEQLRIFRETMESPYLASKPLLVINNTLNHPQVIQPSHLTPLFPLFSSQQQQDGGGVGGMFKICTQSSPINAIANEEEEDEDEMAGGLDESVGEGVEWLISTIISSYSHLSQRVDDDMKLKDQEIMREKEEKMKRVMKEQLKKAYYKVFDHEDEEVESDLMEEQDGLEFLR